MNHFKRVTEVDVVEPPFLVRDVDSRRAVQRLKMKMTEQGIEIGEPRKKSALNGMAAVAVAFEQQESLLDALEGSYAQRWADTEQAVQAAYPAALRPLVDTLFGRNRPLDAPQVRRDIRAGLSARAPSDEVQRALDFLYRAWELRQQVVVEGRPMSLIPAVGGELQGDTPSFTPVVQRLDDEMTWRLGWEGDPAPTSPKVFQGSNLRDALEQVYRTYTGWYQRDQQRALEKLRQIKERQSFPNSLYLPVWGYCLRTQALVLGPQGEVRLENVSHNRLFRLRYQNGGRDARQVIFEAGTEEGVLLAIAVLGERELVENNYPPPAQVEEAYLSLLGGRAAPAAIEVISANPQDVKPLSAVVGDAYRVAWGSRSATVAWVEGHPTAQAVVSGQDYPARGVLVHNAARDQLGVFPVTPKIKKPDFQDGWGANGAAYLDWRQDRATRRALSAWLAWLWQKKAGLKKYQPAR